MAALQAGVGLDGQLCVVIGGNGIAGQGQVVILVHQTNINVRWAGLAVVAVDTGSSNGVGSKATNDRVVLFLVSCGEETQQRIQMLHGLDARHRHQATGTVNGILQALIVIQCHAEGGLVCPEQLSSEEGLHDGNADTLALAPLEQVEPLFHGADTVLVALFKVIGGIDGKHHHVYDPCVDDTARHRRRVGGKSDVMDDWRLRRNTCILSAVLKLCENILLQNSGACLEKLYQDN